MVSCRDEGNIAICKLYREGLDDSYPTRRWTRYMACQRSPGACRVRGCFILLLLEVSSCDGPDDSKGPGFSSSMTKADLLTS